MSERWADTIRLPCFGITLRLHGKPPGAKSPGGAIASTLRFPGPPGNRLYHAAVDALESLILAHACAGVDVQSPAYVEGIEIAVEAITNHLT
jgi:hypothetical protein